MNGLMTMNEVTNGARRAQGPLVLAALFFLLALSTPARSQSGSGGGTGKVVVQDLHFMSNVGVARGQMLRITVPILNNQDQTGHTRLIFGSDQGVFAGHVKVFNGLTGAEIASFELRNPTAGLHTFDIGGGGDDVLFGGAGGDANRVQLLCEVKLVLRYDPRTKEPGEGIYAPAIEVVEKLSGKTTVHSTLRKVGPGTLILNNNSSSY
jgi:hypothetical protein